MQKSASRTTGTSIQDPATDPQVVFVGKRGPALSARCGDCDGFHTVVTRRDGRTSTVRCNCQLAVTG